MEMQTILKDKALGLSEVPIPKCRLGFREKQLSPLGIQIEERSPVFKSGKPTVQIDKVKQPMVGCTTDGTALRMYHTLLACADT